MEIRPDRSLKETNELRRRDSKAVKLIQDNKANVSKEEILNRYNEVFQGTINLTRHTFLHWDLKNKQRSRS